MPVRTNPDMNNLVYYIGAVSCELQRLMQESPDSHWPGGNKYGWCGGVSGWRGRCAQAGLAFGRAIRFDLNVRAYQISSQVERYCKDLLGIIQNRANPDARFTLSSEELIDIAIGSTVLMQEDNGLSLNGAWTVNSDQTQNLSAEQLYPGQTATATPGGMLTPWDLSGTVTDYSTTLAIGEPARAMVEFADEANPPSVDPEWYRDMVRRMQASSGFTEFSQSTGRISRQPAIDPIEDPFADDRVPGETAHACSRCNNTGVTTDAPQQYESCDPPVGYTLIYPCLHCATFRNAEAMAQAWSDAGAVYESALCGLGHAMIPSNSPLATTIGAS